MHSLFEFGVVIFLMWFSQWVCEWSAWESAVFVLLMMVMVRLTDIEEIMREKQS